MSFRRAALPKTHLDGGEENLPLEPAQAKLLDEAIRRCPEDVVKELDAQVRLRTCRGHCDDKNPAQVIADFLKTILKFRRDFDADNIVNVTIPKGELIHQCWPVYIGRNTDEYGHTMMYESLKQVNIPEILDGKGDIQLRELKAMRVQVLELVTRIKAQTSAAKGHTVYKHNVIFDIAGLSGSIFSSRIRAVVKAMILEVTECYPEALHKMFLINAPRAFRFIWAVISPWVQPSTRAKIHILGDAKDLQKQEGLSLAEIPQQLGGQNPMTTSWQLLQDIQAENRRKDQAIQAKLAQEQQAKVRQQDDEQQKITPLPVEPRQKAHAPNSRPSPTHRAVHTRSNGAASSANAASSVQKPAELTGILLKIQECSEERCFLEYGVRNWNAYSHSAQPYSV